MVSADNLNHDVLELIFYHLPLYDLPVAALVSKSFLHAVTPRLYFSIRFGLHHAKKYPHVASVFGTILAKPRLALYVNHCDVTAIPTLKKLPNSMFIHECAQTLRICSNIVKFTCTANITPSLLQHLLDKERLRHLRLYADLTPAQSEMVTKLQGLHSIFTDVASWSFIHLLPEWGKRMASTLTVVVLHMSNELNEVILDSLLAALPSLRGLHVVGCPKTSHVVVLRSIRHNPLLEALSLTAMETSRPISFAPASLSRLSHLCIDIRGSSMQASQLITAILSHVESGYPSLSSFIVKVPQGKLILEPQVAEKLLAVHASTLTCISTINCQFEPMSGLLRTCIDCRNLRRLEMPLALKELSSFTTVISHSRTLETIVDTTGELCGHAVPLNTQSVKIIMSRVPTLKKIVSQRRVWTGGHGGKPVTYTKRQPKGSYWFLPRE